MFHYTSHHILLNILSSNRPQALAWIAGNENHPQLNGMVKFYGIPYDGILIEAELFHLPEIPPGAPSSLFGFHIHENSDCSDNFQNTGNHYNPTGAQHPFHAGDLPPLMSSRGYAWTAFYTTKLSIPELIGKSVVIHGHPDDFTTQPSGNSGEKIGCGVIRPIEN